MSFSFKNVSLRNTQSKNSEDEKITDLIRKSRRLPTDCTVMGITSARKNSRERFPLGGIGFSWSLSAGTWQLLQTLYLSLISTSFFTGCSVFCLCWICSTMSIWKSTSRLTAAAKTAFHCPAAKGCGRPNPHQLGEQNTASILTLGKETCA